jgi:hypothetical protein
MIFGSIDVGKQCRKCTLFDTMIMVAAAAISLWLSKSHYDQLIRADAYQFAGTLIPWSGRWLLAYSEWLKGWGFCWLVPCSWAFLVIRLRPPRPGLRRLLQQPGMAAIAQVGLFMAITGALCAARKVLLPASGTSYYLGYRLEALTVQGGLMALSAWLVLALSGRCRRESGWIDHTGTVLGICWIGAWLTRYLGMLWDC